MHQQLVRYQPKSLDIVYEITFRTPFFTLPRNNLEIWQAFYKHLAPKFLVQSSDFTVVGGTVLSHVRAVLNLFRGNTTLEVTSDQFRATFRNAISPGDTEIVQDCLTRSVTALSTVLPESQLGLEHITAHSLLAVEGEASVRAEFLERFRSSPLNGLRSDTTQIVTPAMHLDIENTTDKWLVTAELSRAWADQMSLFLALNAYFSSGASAAGISQRAQVVQEVGRKILKTVGLEPIPQPT